MMTYVPRASAFVQVPNVRAFMMRMLPDKLNVLLIVPPRTQPRPQLATLPPPPPPLLVVNPLISRQILSSRLHHES